jgi:hypothetical protein
MGQKGSFRFGNHRTSTMTDAAMPESPYKVENSITQEDNYLGTESSLI